MVKNIQCLLVWLMDSTKTGLGPQCVNCSPLDKMATTLANNISKCFFMNELDKTFIHISLKCVPKSSADNKPSLVQVTACCLFSAKPLPEPMMTKFIDAYMRHLGEMCQSSCYYCTQQPLIMLLQHTSNYSLCSNTHQELSPPQYEYKQGIYIINHIQG